MFLLLPVFEDARSLLVNRLFSEILKFLYVHSIAQVRMESHAEGSNIA